MAKSNISKEIPTNWYDTIKNNRSFYNTLSVGLSLIISTISFNGIGVVFHQYTVKKTSLETQFREVNLVRKLCIRDPIPKQNLLGVTCLVQPETN